MAAKTAVALVASAALAPVTPPPGAKEIDHGDGTATVSSAGTDQAERISRAEFDEAKASAALLADELTLERTRTESLRAELTDTRARFNAAWDERERAIADLLSAAAAPAPVDPPRKPVADAQLVLVVGGKRTVLMPGDAIPDGVDVASLPAGSVR